MKRLILTATITIMILVSNLNTVFSFTIDLRKPKPCVNFHSFVHYPSFQLYYEFSVYEGIFNDTDTYHYKIFIEQNGHSEFMYENTCTGDEIISGFINLQNYTPLCFNEKAVFRLDVKKYYQGGFFSTRYGYFTLYKNQPSCNYTSVYNGVRELMNSNFMPITIYGTCGGLASGTYFIKRSKVTFTLNGDFRDSIPVIEPSLSMGYSGSGPNNQNLWAAVVESTETMYKFVTFTYEVHDILGRYWGNIPCNPEKATVVYKYIRKPAIGNLSNYPSNPSPGNSVSYISCNLFQGNGNLNYQWRDSNGTRYRVLLTPLENNRAKFQVFFNETGSSSLFEDSAYYYFVKVSNQAGSTDWIRRKVRFNLNPVSCPEAVITEEKDSLTENSILIKSKLQNSDVTDYMMLQNPFIKNKSGIDITLRENRNEKTYLDNAALYIIETNTDENSAVTDDGKIISYNESEGKAKIIKNDNEDVSLLLEESDDLSLDMLKDDQLEILSESGQTKFVLLKIHSPYNKYESAGNITDEGGNSHDFYSRDYENLVCIKLNGENAGALKLTANQNFVINMIRVLNKSEYKTVQELNLKSAYDNNLNDVTGLIKFQDGLYGAVNKESSITLSFENSGNSGGRVHYMLKTSGKIFESGEAMRNPAFAKSEKQQETVLHGNIPNPFNPVTKIRFSIARAGNVKLSIFDITGKEVTSLADGKMEAGNHEVEFNGSKFSSGVYFYKLETDDKVQTKRMILLK